ncbi:SGNH/GDSL hydrolase family protein [Ligilactobacillus salivarius]|uniref:SGNH/GDSL hydrolase family protein n=1 Tax=Ligilactobacillus salivarius TaxID=1624 RepID=A0AAW7NA14_9LACO|nr:SGNH/GDSL hydrolase family protein [Ligilactobacillus salivarius]MDN4833986.1 SGNH/GDSL hydrolase family protein [Ligilactobacillus salivarius]
MDNPYRDETPMTGDYISNDIRTIAEAIRHKKYGVATRDAMAQSLEKMGRLAMQSVTDPNSVAKQAYDVAYNADSRSIANSSRLDKLVTPSKSDSSVEVNDARVGATSLGGVTYENLGSSIRGQIDTLNGKVISADMIKLNALNIKPYASYGKEIAYYDTGTKKPVLHEKADAISVDMSVSEMPARISFKVSNSTQKIIFYKANSKATNISNSNETTFQQSYGLYECHNGYFTIKTDSFALNGFDRVAFALDVMYQEVLDASADVDGKTLLDWYKKTGSSYNVSLSMFSNFAVLGDSYSVGTLYRDGTWKSVFKLQWPQLIARKWGITAKTFSKGGLSTRTWLTDDVGLKNLKSSDVQDLYCICLGINDNAILSKDPSYLGTTDNIGDNSDTFYGNYSRIVSEVKAKAPHSKIICFGLSQTVEYYPQITNAIRNIAKAYNIPFVDLLSNDFFKSNWYNSMLGGHPVGPVYGGMATAYESLIQNAIQDNSSYFADYAFY